MILPAGFILERIISAVLLRFQGDCTGICWITENVKVFTVIAEWFEIGASTITTPSGNTVRVYDKERCICDILREKKRMDIQVFQTAMNSYFRDRDKDIHKLMQYAQVFGIQEKMRQYTEVLL